MVIFGSFFYAFPTVNSAANALQKV